MVERLGGNPVMEAVDDIFIRDIWDCSAYVEEALQVWPDGLVTLLSA